MDCGKSNDVYGYINSVNKNSRGNSGDLYNEKNYVNSNYNTCTETLNVENDKFNDVQTDATYANKKENFHEIQTDATYVNKKEKFSNFQTEAICVNKNDKLNDIHTDVIYVHKNRNQCFGDPYKKISDIIKISNEEIRVENRNSNDIYADMGCVNTDFNDVAFAYEPHEDIYLLYI